MMTMEDESLTLSPVFLSLTRPAMKLGVTLDYLAANTMISLCLFILSNSPLYALIFIPLHIVGWIGCSLDPFIFTILYKRTECGHCPNKKYWGCVSYEPY